CGARVGQPGEWPRADLRGLRVLVGSAKHDKWIARTDLDATIAWFREAGASVDDVSGPGERHEITLRQRIRARELVLGPQLRGGEGLGNTITSEALPGAVPALQTSPRVPAHGLYAEQVNGTGFTAPRAENQRSWLYRVRPSAQRRAFTPLTPSLIASSFDGAPEINLCGFAPLPYPDGERDFVDGLVTLCGAGSAALRRGYAFHVYAANRSMESRAFYSADGDLLILPEVGALTIATEMGPLEVAPGQLAIIPRGIVFSVLLQGSHARGYVAEPFGRHFRLPDRGPIGANGLADPRHFRAPAAWFEERLAPDFRVVAKLGGALHEASQDHSPFDVAGWFGNYAPFVYDLSSFSPVGNTRFDHGDPSVHTVLSAPLDEPGTHTLDFVVFPTRWDATTNTFRPPFFHRNPIAEINGIVREQSKGPFQPGCCFITPSLTAHGISGRGVERQRNLGDAEADQPVQLGGASLWFQLESALSPVLTPWAREHALPEWAATWGSHRSYYS
ncbi:MAG TPA: homogentisate 1,2-dioxygenase, partial [Kofleriaceae bacterium]|nr:homogentisate 1,2-dioxygenase [Kofleriaceae bacterium]